MKIAVIPARGGSKRIPRKNIKLFRGRPMLAWSVAKALESGLFDQVVVSTDDDEIADVALSAGAAVPFRRPPELANDQTPTVPAIAHAVSACQALGWTVNVACCIYPCSPFVQVSDLVRAHTLLTERGADYVYPVTTFAHPVQRAMRQRADGSMEFVQPAHEMTRTQDLETLYHDCGQFYFGTAAAWLAHKRMHTAGIGMPIPSWRVVDIDNDDDWHRAELLAEAFAGEWSKA